jgi:hypothetical protein
MKFYCTLCELNVHLTDSHLPLQPRTVGYGFHDGPNCSHNMFYNYLRDRKQAAIECSSLTSSIDSLLFLLLTVLLLFCLPPHLPPLPSILLSFFLLFLFLFLFLLSLFHLCCDVWLTFFAPQQCSTSTRMCEGLFPHFCGVCILRVGVFCSCYIALMSRRICDVECYLLLCVFRSLGTRNFLSSGLAPIIAPNETSLFPHAQFNHLESIHHDSPLLPHLSFFN